MSQNLKLKCRWPVATNFSNLFNCCLFQPELVQQTSVLFCIIQTSKNSASDIIFSLLSIMVNLILDQFLIFFPLTKKKLDYFPYYQSKFIDLFLIFYLLLSRIVVQQVNMLKPLLLNQTKIILIYFSRTTAHQQSTVK